MHEKFNTSTVQQPLRVNASYVVGQYGWDILSGSIFMPASEYTNLVFEVENSFIPASVNDLAGIKLSRGTDKQELYEYYNPDENSGGVKFVKVVKSIDTFFGYGSNDGVNWFERGYVTFPSIETIAVNVESTMPYSINSLKVYKSEYITISSLLPEWRIRIESSTVDYEVVANSDTVHVKLPKYPYSGKFSIFDKDDIKVAESQLSDVWGGDEMICTLDLELYSSTGDSLTFDFARHLGTLENDQLVDFIVAKNVGNEDLLATIRIADYSPFGEWVTLSNDFGDSPSDFTREIALPVSAHGETKFWLKIARTGANIPYDYKNTECLFYLEVI